MTRSAPIRKNPAVRRRTRSGGVFAMSRGGHFNATRCIEVNYGAACGRNDGSAPCAEMTAALRESRRLGGGSVRRRQDGGFPNLLKGPTS